MTSNDFKTSMKSYFLNIREAVTGEVVEVGCELKRRDESQQPPSPEGSNSPAASLSPHPQETVFTNRRKYS